MAIAEHEAMIGADLRAPTVRSQQLYSIWKHAHQFEYRVARCDVGQEPVKFVSRDHPEGDSC